MSRNYWTREETILLLDLYLRMDSLVNHDIEIKKLSDMIIKTKLSIRQKFAIMSAQQSADPAIVSASPHASRDTVNVWREFYHNRKKLADEVRRIVAKCEIIKKNRGY